MRLADCHNVDRLRALARRRLPAPIFHYIDGAADDEVTAHRNVAAFEDCDLVPNVLANVAEPDLSVTVLGQKLELPLFCSPTAIQRLFHHEGEAAVARAAARFGTMCGVSSLSTFALSEVAAASRGPKMFQFYFHKDRGLNQALLEQAKAAQFDVLALTVDTITGGNRERDLRTGFTSPPRLTWRSALSFALHPNWTLNYLLRRKFDLPALQAHVQEGTSIAISIGEYFSTMLDARMDWDDAARLREAWGRPFCLKGVMSAADARRAVALGADAIMLSNHGGRQLDGGRAPLDQLAEIVDAVGGQIEIILDGGIRRGTHVLKALAAGATACSGGRFYLYALGAAGQPGVEKTLANMQAEIRRGMQLMGVSRLSELQPSMLRWR